MNFASGEAPKAYSQSIKQITPHQNRWAGKGASVLGFIRENPTKQRQIGKKNAVQLWGRRNTMAADNSGRSMNG